MPFLLYCVAPESATETGVHGVGDAQVHSSVHDGLRYFYSDAAADDLSARDMVTAAQQVHAVVSDIFERAPVLPFRYPTVLANEVELATLATARSPAFREYLERVRSKVQMDIRLTVGDLAPSGEPSSSGRAYLEARSRRQASLSDAAETCRQAVHSAEWRIQQRGENIRCQALIRRVEVLSFLERMRTLELPEGVKAAVSGPWPPAGFWEDEPR